MRTYLHWEGIMKPLFPMLLLLALSVPALAQSTPTPSYKPKPAPGPLLGAGLLPVLLVGGGIYWIVRRKRTPSAIDGDRAGGWCPRWARQAQRRRGRRRLGPGNRGRVQRSPVTGAEGRDGTHCAYEGMVWIANMGPKLFWVPPGVLCRCRQRAGRSHPVVRFSQSLQKSLNRSGASAV